MLRVNGMSCVLVCAFAVMLGGCAYDWDELRGGPSSSAVGCAGYPDALFCSDFESGDLKDWRVKDGADIPTIIENAASGSYAAKLETPGNGSRGFVDAPVGLVGDAFYGRAYYYLPSSMEIMHFGAFNVFENPAAEVFSVLFLGNGHPNGWISQDRQVVEGTVALPRDEWFCLRVEAEFGASGSLRVWIEDQLSVDARGSMSASGVEFVSMPARYTHDGSTNTQGPVEVWFDDVVIDDEPVGCQP